MSYLNHSFVTFAIAASFAVAYPAQAKVLLSSDAWDHSGFPLKVCVTAGPPCDLPGAWDAEVVPTVQGQAQQVPMGNFCLTQAGRFGPGPMNPLGSFCQAGTPWGVVPGTVGR